MTPGLVNAGSIHMNTHNLKDYRSRSAFSGSTTIDRSYRVYIKVES